MSPPSFRGPRIRHPTGTVSMMPPHRDGQSPAFGGEGALLPGELRLSGGVVVDVLVGGEIDRHLDEVAGEPEGPDEPTGAVVVGHRGAAVEADVEPREGD